MVNELTDSQKEPRRHATTIVRYFAATVIACALAAGAVYLYANSHPLRGGIEGCTTVRDRTARLDCFTDNMSALVKDRGLDKALQYVDQAARTHSTIGTDCHLAWHPIGEKFGKEAEHASEPIPSLPVDSFCNEGYTHGFLIGYFTGSPVSVDATRGIAKLCIAWTGDTGPETCVHTFGHIFARNADGDAQRAEESCRSAVTAPVRRAVDDALFHCMYGLYMEISLLDNSKPNAQLHNCRASARDDALLGCYSFLPARVAQFTSDTQQAADACHKYPPAKVFKEACIRSFAKGIRSIDECTMLPTKEEQAYCRRAVELPSIAI